ncbi:MAG TPA: hypothetical protein VNA89_08315, partial [Gemmatimonadaceae bacterium]|nr:hypothetical protein [Gemmatimonadaceae bacterium]
MSDAVTLTLRAAPPGPLDMDGVTPERCAGLGEREIAALDLWCGRERLALGELFAVRGARAAELRLAGDLALARGVGAGMRAGLLVVDGDAGDEAGRGMTGGEIEVRGDAGADAAAYARRGVIAVAGTAGAGAA